MDIPYHFSDRNLPSKKLFNCWSLISMWRFYIAAFCFVLKILLMKLPAQTIKTETKSADSAYINENYGTCAIVLKLRLVSTTAALRCAARCERQSAIVSDIASAALCSATYRYIYRSLSLVETGLYCRKHFGLRIPSGYGNNDETLHRSLLEHPV